MSGKQSRDVSQHPRWKQRVQALCCTVGGTEAESGQLSAEGKGSPGFQGGRGPRSVARSWANPFAFVDFGFPTVQGMCQT